MEITQLSPARIGADGAPEMIFVTRPSQSQPQPVEGVVVRGILARAENHLVYLSDSGASESAMTEQRQYIEAAELLLTRLC